MESISVPPGEDYIAWRIGMIEKEKKQGGFIPGFFSPFLRNLDELYATKGPRYPDDFSRAQKLIKEKVSLGQEFNDDLVAGVEKERQGLEQKISDLERRAQLMTPRQIVSEEVKILEHHAWLWCLRLAIVELEKEEPCPNHCP